MTESVPLNEKTIKYEGKSFRNLKLNFLGSVNAEKESHIFMKTEPW